MYPLSRNGEAASLLCGGSRSCVRAVSRREIRHCDYGDDDLHASVYCILTNAEIVYVYRGGDGIERAGNGCGAIL